MANWYAYMGKGDPTLPGSYRLATTKPNCSLGGTMICAIYINQGSDVPAMIDVDTLDYITNALIGQISQPHGTSKRFVYVKCPC